MGGSLSRLLIEDMLTRPHGLDGNWEQKCKFRFNDCVGGWGVAGVQPHVCPCSRR